MILELLDRLTNKRSAQANTQGHLVVAQGLAKYADLVLQGKVYSGMTAAAGVAPGTAVGTTSAFAIHNPLGSRKNLVILRATMGYISGTLGAGVVVYAANVDPQLARPTGTAIAAKNAKLGSGPAAVALPLTTATVGTPLTLRPFANLDASLATTAGIGGQIAGEDVDGEFVVTPGTTLNLQGIAAAGTIPLVAFGMTWAEIDE